MKRMSILLALLVAACQSTETAPAEPESGSAAPVDDGLVWAARAYPTGDRSTSAVLVRRGLPREIQSGQRYDYEIHVTNLTDQKITEVVLRDTAPPEFQAAEGSTETTPGGKFAVWTLGDIDGGATVVLKASGLAGVPGAFEHVCHVTYQAPLYGATTVTLPKLTLKKRVDEVVILADGIEYVYEIANEGTGTARDVRIEEQLPTGLKTADGNDKVEIEVGELPAGSGGGFTVRCTTELTGTYTGRARATAFGGLEALSEDVAVRVTKPVLSVSVEAPGKAAIGQVFTMKVVVANQGDGPCRDLAIEHDVPDGAVYVESSDAGVLQGAAVHWVVAEPLEPGQTRTVTAKFRAGQARLAVSGARATGHGAAETATQSQTELYGIATLEVDVKDSADPVEVGGQVTYTVAVTNQGTATATNLKLVATMEEGMSYASSTGPTTGSANGNTVAFESAAALEPQQTLTWQIVVQADKEGDHRFRVAITGDQFSRPVEGFESTKSFR